MRVIRYRAYSDRLLQEMYKAALNAYARADERGSEPDKILSDMLDLVHYASLLFSGQSFQICQKPP